MLFLSMVSLFQETGILTSQSQLAINETFMQIAADGVKNSNEGSVVWHTAANDVSFF